MHSDERREVPLTEGNGIQDILTHNHKTFIYAELQENFENTVYFFETFPEIWKNYQHLNSLNGQDCSTMERRRTRE